MQIYGVDNHDEYDAEGWDLHCRIELEKASSEAKRFMSCFVKSLAFIDDGRCILFRPGIRRPTNDDKPIHQLCAYDPATGAMEELLADGSLIAQPSVNGTATTKAVIYEESLVSTGRPHEDIIFSPTSVQALSMALCLLPARDLGRFKLVCRSWRAMMETNRFVELYTRHAGTRRRLSDDPMRIFLPKDDYRSSDSESPQLLEQRVVSSKPCHGLLAVSRSGHEISVLNPATDEEINYGFHDSDYITRKDQNSVTVCHGLGYDEAAEDHVAVTVVSRSDGGGMKECWLRRLKEGGKIRTVKSAPPVHAWLDVPPVFVHGKMYWMGKPDHHRGNNNMIMALEIKTEAFDVLPGPLVDLDNDGGRMLVAELGGELCVAHSCPNTETMTIWTKTTETMEEGQAGWKRELAVAGVLAEDGGGAGGSGGGAVDGGGRVLLDTGREVGVYDPRNKTMRTVYSLKYVEPWRSRRQVRRGGAAGGQLWCLLRMDQGNGATATEMYSWS
ncbi:hypothetical protein BRADI_3g60311v3 [Brachypodium distachyon]|uniref:Uncharacterized protein n=1 Tax=Brachypodium distachyon TaxID=15368 RepID=A0A0Q3QKT0_BRADI|nr:hypothetical protein BRADI_3g60311v3 [Brachypodium distachyon]